MRCVSIQLEAGCVNWCRTRRRPQTMFATLRLFNHFTWLLCFCGIKAAEAGTGCKVVNLMPAFWRSWETSDAAVQIRTTLIVPNPDLYNDNYVNLPAGAKWEAAVARERTFVETRREE